MASMADFFNSTKDQEWHQLRELINALPTRVEVKCGNCGEKFETYRSTLMARIQQSVSGYLFCTRKCNMEYVSNARSRDNSTIPEQTIRAITVDFPGRQPQWD